MTPPAPGTMYMPQGLAYLTSLDQLIIRKKRDMPEIFSGFETRNKYEIANSMNQPIFFAQEESSPVGCCADAVRGFKLHITDNNKQEVMRISRDFKGTCTAFCWCADGNCGMVLTIEAPVGKVIGTVRQSTSMCMPHMKLFDAFDKHLLSSWGPCCPCTTCCRPGDINYPVTDPSLRTSVANIARQYPAEQFCLTFPRDMSIDNKCILIGSLFLVEYLLFEMGKTPGYDY